jgi:hypothetical protein
MVGLARIAWASLVGIAATGQTAWWLA